MSYTRKIIAKIRKEDELVDALDKKIEELKIELREKRSRLVAFQEALKIMPSDGEKTKKDSPLKGIRKGSTADMARNVLREKGQPMSAKEILCGIGEEYSKKRRQAVSSILSAYVRNQDIFTRPEPGIFSLKEFETEMEQEGEERPPLVKALARGYYDDVIINPGDVFQLKKLEDFSTRWMTKALSTEIEKRRK